MRRRLWTLLAVLTCVSGEYLMGGHLDNNAESQRSSKIENSSTLERKTRLDDLDLDLVAEESSVAVGATAEVPTGDNDGDVPRYHIPYPFAFNGGKPFSLEKDPITGKIDFEKAPPVKALNYTDYREREDKEDDDEDDDNKKNVHSERKRNKGKDNEDVSPNEINTYANFHDFLNLPVHYSSDKYGNDKYPLISSSYANTKVQSGANSYSTYNHRPYHSENDLYARPIKNSYTPITKTSTHKTTAIDDKAKWMSPSTITTSVPAITTNSSRTMPPTSTKAPAVTTWKPSNSPIAFHSIDRTEMENEKNLLPIEKLHASSHIESHRNPSNIPMRTPNDAAMIEKTQTTVLHKDHSNLDNFVISHARPETKPAQNEEYRDSYDTYELPDGEGEGDAEGEADSNGNSEESDYFLPFKDLLKDFTSVSSTTTSPTASTAAPITTTTATTTTTTITASSAGTTTAATTVMPLRSVSSTPSILRENTLVNSPSKFPLISQHPIVSSSLKSDRRQSVTERYDIISHGYRSTPKPVKLEPNRIGAGTVVESTSNIVIPPDQDVVSFVLGNRQSVEGGYYSVGTAVGENLYGSLSDSDATLWPLHNDPNGPTKGVKQEHLSAHSVTELSSPDRDTQKWWLPSPVKTSNEIEPMKSQGPLVAIASAVIQDTKNRSKERDSSYVIFPDDETKDKDATTEKRIVIVNEADGSIREVITPKTTTLTTTMITTTMNKTKLNVSATIGGDFSQLAEDLIPPAESSGSPPYYYHYQYDVPRPDHSRLPQRSPLSPPPPRIKPHSVPPLDAGLRKRPYPPDTKLPNILPQFRPNAKASHGHRGPDTIGTMPAGQGSSGTRIRQPLPSHSSTSRRPLLPPPPSYLQRLNPPPPPIHAIRLALVPTSNVDNIVLPHETESIRTRFRPPHATPSISRVSLDENKLFAHGIGQAGTMGKNAESRKEDHGKSEITGERENEERYSEEPPMTPPRPPLFPKRRTADPPRVATLQMIQHHGELIGDNDETNEPVEPVLAQEAERRKSDNHDPAEIPEQPVYVVYPVNTAVNIHPDDSNEKDGSVVVGTRGPHRPLPPDTLLQNEPTDEAHTVYNGRPLVVQDFPYPLERPDPTSVFPVTVKETPLLIPSKQRQQQLQQQQTSVSSEPEKNEKDEHVDTVNMISYLQEFLPTSNRKKNDAAISVTLHRTGSIATASTSASTSTASTSTSMPIAYVYTPTYAPYSIRLDEDVDDDDDDRADVANVDAKQTVLLPSQQPSSSSSSAPAPQNFMAPFVASMSAETPSKNGWSVVVVEPPVGAERKSDNDDGEKLVNSEIETQTERNEFDADNFKPQLFGGFKPIYEFPTEDAGHRDVADTNTEIDTPRYSKELLSVSDKG